MRGTPRAVAIVGLAALALHLAATSSAAEDAMAPVAPRNVVRDPAYFRDRVLPLLERDCAGCHDAADKANATKHRIERRAKDAPWTDDAVRRNYEMLVRLLDAQQPERSLVLAKLTPIAQGGVDHDGGKANDVDLPRDLIDPKGPLVAWIFGASATSSPPIAVAAPLPRTVTLGDPLPLDASKSFDPDGGDVSVDWDVVEAPQGAHARIDDPRAKRTRIVPDREGPWIVRLKPSGARLTGWPLRLRFAVVRRTDAGAAAPTVPVDVDEASRRLTRRLFLDLWGRTPTEDELARWCAWPREERVARMLDAIETWQAWFDEESFYFLLIDQFRPVSDRLAAVPAKLRDGAITIADAHREFAVSAEFNARNPGNDTYVTVVLEQFLGLEVQKQPRVLEAGKKMYDGAVARLFDVKGDTQADVVKIALAQPGYLELFLRRMERRYLGEDLPKVEHDAALALLAANPGSFKTLLHDWLLSERCVGSLRVPKPKTDRQFIRSLFVDLLGRPPAYEEFRNMRNALQAVADPNPVRGVLAKVLLDSGVALPPAGTDDPESQVRELFHRFLGRDPTRKEIVVYTEALRRPGATWRIAALALLTSPQYQHY